MLSISTDIIHLGQIVLAIFLGGIVGVERERSGKSAGPRTHALVTAGAAMVTMLSLNLDTPSIIGQIVAGVGFLGVGTILHRQDNHIEGLTTAAGIWMTATIGIAVGTGHYVLAVGSTLIILLLLMTNDRKFGGQRIQ